VLATRVCLCLCVSYTCVFVSAGRSVSCSGGTGWTEEVPGGEVESG